MKLTEMTIDYFRSIKNCHVYFDEINAVVGENNAGKTALLRALNSVFNWKYEEPYFLNNAHQYSPRTKTKISLVFDALPDKEIYSNKQVDGKLTLVFTYAYSNTTRKKTLGYISQQQEIISVDDSFIGCLKQDIDYVYIPAGRGGKELTWGNDSIFSRVLSAYAKASMQNRDTLSIKVSNVSDSFKNKIFARLENELQTASMLEASENYKLGFTDGIDYTIFLNHVGLNINESGRILPIGEYGSGIKSITVIALYRALAKLQGVNVILGIEEPETNLHPHAQKKLIASLKDGRQDQEIQAIFATHSTVIVDELSHEDIILARRVQDTRRGFYTEYTQLSHSFWTDYNLDEYKHNNFFRYRNSEFFFSRFVVVVESITDAQVVNELIKDEIGERIYHISILNLDGVKNLKYPYFLLKSLGIPFAMVVDRDFLSQYSNGSLDASRNAVTFLPSYTAIPNSRNAVIKDIWNSSALLSALEDHMKKSYSKLFTYCQAKNMYVMQYCLEMDLVAADKARATYCQLYGITNDNTSYKKLLIDRKDAIKSPDKILQIVSSLQPMDYPFSFKKIRRALVDEINAKVHI